MTEQCIIGARASVMVYDDTQKKWVPSGTSSGLSKVQIFHHQQNNTFRVVGRKLQDHEVVINCSIVKGLKYNQATCTFHQWRDFKYVYGLNFSSSQDAEAFARAMMHALEVLSGRAIGQPTGIMQPTNGNSNEEDMGYRTMTREDAAMLQQPLNGSPQTPTSQQNQNNIPQSPPTPQGHHRTSSAPPAPQPPQMSMPPQQQQQIYNQGGMMQPQMHNGGGMPPIPPQGPQQTNPYHAPQQLQQQPPPQQQQQHPVYSSQPLNSNYQQNQYQQLIYVSSASLTSNNLNQNPYLQQPPQNMSGGVVGMPPQPPLPAMMHQNGPIYVSTQQQQPQPPPQGPGIPNSASSNSVIYASQQIKQEPLGPQPPQPQSNNNYGQTNGHHQIDGVYGQIPVAPPINGMPPLNNGSGNVPVPPPMMNNRGGAPVPPAPPAPPAMIGGGAPPPPPPPPMMAGGPPAPPAPPMKKEPDAAQDFMGSLAAQLQQAKLKKNKNATPQPVENSGSSTSSGNSAGNYGTIGRSSKGMVSMMDEMAKTLARRRAQVDKKDQPSGEIVSDDVKQRPWEKSNTLPHKLGSNSSGSNNASNNGNGNGSGSESPRPMRKRFGSASEETILKQVNGDGLSIALSDLDSLKAEIVREMRLEIQKAKQEIIEAIKTEFNRR